MIEALFKVGFIALIVGLPVAAGVMADKERQRCWTQHGAGNLGCKGDGTYKPNANFTTR